MPIPSMTYAASSNTGLPMGRQRPARHAFPQDTTKTAWEMPRPLGKSRLSFSAAWQPWLCWQHSSRPIALRPRLSSGLPLSNNDLLNLRGGYSTHECSRARVLHSYSIYRMRPHQDAGWGSRFGGTSVLSCHTRKQRNTQNRTSGLFDKYSIVRHISPVSEDHLRASQLLF